MTHKADFIRSLRWLAAGRLAGQLLSWIGTIWVMRLVSPDDYALVAICTVILTLVTLVAELGFGAAIVQAKSITTEETRAIFGAALAFSTMCAGVMAAVAPALAAFYNAPRAEPMIQVSALTLVLAALATVPDAQLRRQMAFARISILELLAGISAMVVTLLLAIRGAGAWSLIGGPVAGAAVRALLLHSICTERVWPSTDFRRAKPLLRFGLTVSASRMASFVFSQADIAIGARFVSKSALGEYSIAMHLAMLPMSKLMGMVNSVALPAIANLNRKDAPVAQALLASLRPLALIVVPALWGLAAIAPWFIPALLGPAWTGAVLPLQIICLVLPLRLLSVLMTTALQGLGQAGLDLRNTTTGAIVLPPLFLVGAQFGAIGLAVAWLVGLPLMVALNLRRAAPHLGMRLRHIALAMARPALIAALVASTILACGFALGERAHSVIGLSGLIAVAASTYLILTWTLDRQGAQQLLEFFVGSKRAGRSGEISGD